MYYGLMILPRMMPDDMTAGLDDNMQQDPQEMLTFLLNTLVSKASNEDEVKQLFCVKMITEVTPFRILTKRIYQNLRPHRIHLGNDVRRNRVPK